MIREGSHALVFLCFSRGHASQHGHGYRGYSRSVEANSRGLANSAQIMSFLKLFENVRNFKCAVLCFQVQILVCYHRQLLKLK